MPSEAFATTLYPTSHDRMLPVDVDELEALDCVLTQQAASPHILQLEGLPNIRNLP